MRMFELREALALLALCSLIGLVSAERSIGEYCEDLSRSMAWDPEVRTNTRLAMSEGLKQLRSLSNVLKSKRHKLADAWEAMVKDAPCDSSSVGHVAVIGMCAPEKHPELATLEQAVRRHVDKCMKPGFWDYILRKTLSSMFGAEQKSGVKRLLSDSFIEQYRKDNPTEPKLNLDYTPNDSEGCCRPWKSHRALFDALAPIVDFEGSARLSKIIVDKPDEFESLLDRFLFKPCVNYLENMGDLVYYANLASKYYKDGSEAFVEQELSPEFRNAVFRYKYCTAFHRRGGPVNKLNLIGYHAFWKYTM